MRGHARVGWLSFGFCAIVLVVPAWAEVEVSKTYGALGVVSTKAITVEGVGVGAARPKGTEALQRAGELAALIVAVRTMGELFDVLRHDLQRLQNKEIVDIVLKPYVGINTLFPSTSAAIGLRPPDLTSPMVTSSLVRLGSVEVLGTSVIHGTMVVDDTIRVYIGQRELRIENFATGEAEALPVVTAWLADQGFEWTFKSNNDGTVTCRLAYPRAELTRRLEPGGAR